MARYSLMAENRKTGDTALIRVKETNNNGIEEYKDKVNLSTIDRFTLGFSDEEELVNSLYQSGIIPFSDASMFIQYISKGQKVKLPLAYKNLEALNYFAFNAPIKVSIIDPKYINMINSFLKDCLDYDFLKYQVDNGFLHEYNEAYVKEFVRLANEHDDPRGIDRIRSLIYTLLNRYKRIRGIIVGSSEYRKHVIEQIPDVEIIDQYDDPDKEIFGTGYIGDRLSNQKRIELN